jgi:DNA (cytosine-5)-methyltransferase 1
VHRPVAAVPSIFDRSKPLADDTLRRIAAGIKRYVIESADPFIVSLTHQGGDRVEGIDEPFKTLTGAHRGEKALAVPTLIQTGYDERQGQAPRVPGLDKPLGTVVGCGQKHALVSAFLAKHYGGVVGTHLREPIGTVTATDHHNLAASQLVKLHGTCKEGQSVTEPVATVRAQGTHIGEVRAFLLKYFGTDQAPKLGDPMHTLTAKHRMGLVTVHDEEYVIADVGLRMLSPRELFRAQGFPDSFLIDPVVSGKSLTKTAQVRMCGNSVCQPIAAAVARAQFVESRTKMTA